MGTVLFLQGLKNTASGYAITSAGLFNGAGDLSITFGSAGDRKNWTVSFWTLWGDIAKEQYLFSAAFGGNSDSVRYNSNNVFDLFGNGAIDWRLTTSSVYRDPTAWGMLTLSSSTSEATGSNRLDLSWNGELVSSYSTESYPAQNRDGGINDAVLHVIGSWGSSGYFEGALAEFHFVDGQALSPSVFGEFNNGNWEPIKYTGTYGNNGFYLKFEDGALGTDSSGNGNNWTVNGTITAVPNTPTNTAATLNPLIPSSRTNGDLTYEDGNTSCYRNTSAFHGTTTTIGIPSSGKIYIEAYWDQTTAGSPCATFGVCNKNFDFSTNHSSGSGLWGWNIQGSRYLNLNGTRTSQSSAALTAGTRLRMCIDVDNDELYLGVGNDWYDTVSTTNSNPSTNTNPIVSGLGLADKEIALGTYGTITGTIVALESDWTHSAPTGAVALTCANLQTVAGKLSDHMTVVRHNGNETNETISLTDLQGNALDWSGHHILCYSKNDATETWSWHTTLLGLSKYFDSSVGSSNTTDTDRIKTFDGNSYDIGADHRWNRSGFDYSHVFMKAGATADVVSGTTNNSKAYSYSANTEAGFCLATVKGSGSAGHEVPIDLGDYEPGVVAVVNMTSSGYDIKMWHHAYGMTKILRWNGTQAGQNDGGAIFNNVSPTSSIVTLGSSSHGNELNSDILIMAWAKNSPFVQAIGRKGNGSSDGSFSYMGGLPEWFWSKRVDSTSNHLLFDGLRTGYNPDNYAQFPDSSGSQDTSTDRILRVSNGIKCITTANPNDSGDWADFGYVVPFGANRQLRGE